MNFNANGKILAQGLNSNHYIGLLSSSRKTMVLRAFGIHQSKAPTREIGKRKKKYNVAPSLNGTKINYQEDLVEVRRFIEDCFELWAKLLPHASKSQVIHAFCTGSLAALERACERQRLLKIDAAATQLKGDARKQAMKSLKPIESWKDTIEATFASAFHVMTEYERIKAGREAEIAKANEALKKVDTPTTKKGKKISKGAQALNRKKAQREAANVA